MNGYLCIKCGWHETDHLGKVTDWTEEEMAERRRIQPGYLLPLFGKKGALPEEDVQHCAGDYIRHGEELKLYKENPELARQPVTTDDDDNS